MDSQANTTTPMPEGDSEFRKWYMDFHGKLHLPAGRGCVACDRYAAMVQIGDRVRYIGTAKDDDYHGKLCGKVGVVEQLDPYVLLRLDDDPTELWVAGEQFLERVPPAEAADAK
jgi:hypothetical protein